MDLPSEAKVRKTGLSSGSVGSRLLGSILTAVGAQVGGPRGRVVPSLDWAPPSLRKAGTRVAVDLCAWLQPGFLRCPALAAAGMHSVRVFFILTCVSSEITWKIMPRSLPALIFVATQEDLRGFYVPMRCVVFTRVFELLTVQCWILHSCGRHSHAA